jgi:hypothetical protein
MERRESRDTPVGAGRSKQYVPALEPNQLSRDELEAELTIAAYAPGRLRYARFERLLDERRRRLIAA